MMWRWKFHFTAASFHGCLPKALSGTASGSVTRSRARGAQVEINLMVRRWKFLFAATSFHSSCLPEAFLGIVTGANACLQYL